MSNKDKKLRQAKQNDWLNGNSAIENQMQYKSANTQMKLNSIQAKTERNLIEFNTKYNSIESKTERNSIAYKMKYGFKN